MEGASIMQTATDLKSIAARYIELAGEKKYDAVAHILAPDVSFKGPFVTLNSAEAFIGALRRLAPVWERNVVRTAFADGDQACVIYDFVTNTEAGALPCIELLSFRDGRIKSIELFFDRASFAPAQQALAAKAAK
jgi:ketosteroid isomerase-like protein